MNGLVWLGILIVGCTTLAWWLDSRDDDPDIETRARNLAWDAWEAHSEQAMAVAADDFSTWERELTS